MEFDSDNRHIQKTLMYVYYVQLTIGIGGC